MASGDGSGLGTALIFAIVVIINIVSSIWNSAKKSREKKLKQDQQKASHNAGTARPIGMPQRSMKTAPPVRQTAPPQAIGKEAPRSLQEALMRELKRAMSQGQQTPKPQEVRPEQRAVKLARQLNVAPPLPPKLPEPKATPHHARTLFKTDASGQRTTSTGVRLSEAGTVKQKVLGHLAVIRSPEDMRKAMVMHEILSPPRSRRPLGANRIS